VFQVEKHRRSYRYLCELCRLLTCGIGNPKQGYKPTSPHMSSWEVLMIPLCVIAWHTMVCNTGNVQSSQDQDHGSGGYLFMSVLQNSVWQRTDSGLCYLIIIDCWNCRPWSGSGSNDLRQFSPYSFCVLAHDIAIYVPLCSTTFSLLQFLQKGCGVTNANIKQSDSSRQRSNLSALPKQGLLHGNR
jgi:hypothetical protein